MNWDILGKNNFKWRTYYFILFALLLQQLGHSNNKLIFLRQQNPLFFRILLHDCKFWIIWNWFIEKLFEFIYFEAIQKTTNQAECFRL